MAHRMDTIQDIQHVFYINLEHRTDRKKHVEQQLKKIGIRDDAVQRFNAIKPASGNGALGCTMSHLKCLQTAKAAEWDHVCIIEDDIEFLDPPLFVSQLNSFLKNHRTWDVVLIGGNNVPPYKKIDSFCVQVYSCQTTTGYIVRSHYYDHLIDNIKEGMQHLLRNPENRFSYAIDKYWFKLQRQHHWYLIIPLTVAQREDYSDIEKRETNYQRLMVDLDKAHLFRHLTQTNSS
jgi:GR25 family glycosyltransferase involved in LPS biosynthesis